MKRVLIVSPSFPPINAPDMQRVRMSLPHYSTCGWEPIVLAVNERYINAVREEELLATVPTHIKIYRCNALPLSISKLFGIGNLGLRSGWHLLWAGLRVIRREKIDLVFLSNTQFFTFPLGRLWRFLTRVPYVIDLQDPWRTDYYQQPGARKPPGGWKYSFARVQARLLEGWSFRRLSGFVSVSPRYIEDLRERYPWFAKIPSATIPFGTSEEDKDAALASSSPKNGPTMKDRPIRLVYTGAGGPITPHAARLLMQGLRRLRDRRPQTIRHLQLEFHGTSYAAADRACPTIKPIAKEFGVDDIVFENPARIGHLESMRLQAIADALIIAGSIDPAYSPSKLYPYFLAGRPMLGLVLRQSVLERLLFDLSCAKIVSFSPEHSNDSVIEEVAAFFMHAVDGFPPGYLPERNEELFRNEYLAPALTARQCALFEHACQNASE
ncbi:MAG: glycosyltransferase [Nibricoccus sp.]